MSEQELLVADHHIAPPAGDRGRFGGRWRMVGAGLSNVWRYGDLVLPAASGRLLLRGPNGTGKTTALEGLWPFLLDLDRNKLRAGQSRTTTLTSLMREGHADRKRIGYAWLTFAEPGDSARCSWGVRLVFSNGSTPTVKLDPFTIPGEPLIDLPLTGPGRSSITTPEAFRELVESVGGTVFADEDDYVTSLAGRVFEAARSDLIVLADRIRVVRNPSLLAATSAEEASRALREALPGVSGDVIEETGQALASTDETRAAFQRDVDAAATLGAFADVWSGHAADVAGRTTEAAAAARTELAQLIRAHDGREARHRDALDSAEQARIDLTALEVEQQTAQADIDAITKAPAYEAIGRLADLASVAESKQNESTARTEGLARQAGSVVQQIEGLTQDVTALAEAVAATGSAARAVDAGATTAVPMITLAARPQSRLTVGDRAFDVGPQIELAPEPGVLAELADQWADRLRFHRDRVAAATLMLREHQAVDVADRTSGRQSERADEDDGAADTAAQERDQLSDRAREAARAYVATLTAWATDHADLTAAADSDPLDADGITEAAAHGPAALIGSAREWEVDVLRVVERLAAVRLAQAEERLRDAAEQRRLAEVARNQARALRAGEVLPPPRPVWAGSSATPFADAVDWLDDSPDAAADATAEVTRALVESALAASGLLGATLAPTGVQGDTWTVSATGPGVDPGQPNLTALLRIDPAHPLHETAQAVLERVELADSAAAQPHGSVVIGRDGTFRLGVLSGRAPGADDAAAAPRSRYVGAIRRRAAALAEAARLEADADQADVDAVLADTAAGDLRQSADQLRQRGRSFPATVTLERVEQQRVAGALLAERARQRADTSATLARELAVRARELAEEWRDRVVAIGLPVEVSEIDAALRSAETAERGLTEARGTLRRHHAGLVRLAERLTGVWTDREQLFELHATAVSAHDDATRSRLEYDQLQASHGSEANELSARLTAAQSRRSRARTAEVGARQHRDDAVRAEVTALSDARQAAAAVDAARPVANGTLAALAGLVGVQDVADAILHGAQAADGIGLIQQVRDAVRDVATWSKRKVAETYEVARAELAGVWAVDRTDGYTDQLDTYQCTYDGTVLTPWAAARLARDLADRAGQKLHDQEESALRDFIVGRLPAAIGTAWQAQNDWVTEVNRKMATASASSGVGVRVRTTLRDDLSVTERTVHQLACRKSAATRSTEEDQQLAEALRTLLAVAGGETVTDRVREAVDIRQWVRVDYLVHRPGAEPRRWTRNTGLSGGERRLVILAPMLASIAALYANLPPTALRLAALDEVPAEVDERGREGLARYLAELDLDVICTSYLWDGAPGAWDGVDAYDLEASDGIVVGLPMLVRGLDVFDGDPVLDS